MKRDSEGQTASEIREVNDCITSGKNFRSCHENGYSGLISIEFCDFDKRLYSQFPVDTVNFETFKSNETISQSKRCQNSSSKLHNGNA